MSLDESFQRQSLRPIGRPVPNNTKPQVAELTVREMLDDTIVKLVMRRDGVTEDEILEVVDAARAYLSGHSSSAHPDESDKKIRTTEFPGI